MTAIATGRAARPSISAMPHRCCPSARRTAKRWTRSAPLTSRCWPAGLHTQPGQTRPDLLDYNLAVTIEAALPRVLIVVSSPLDVLVEYLTRRWESRPVNVFGTGTSLDSWRLRELLAVEREVHPGNVHAWVIGEHGDSAVFPFEAVRIGPFSLAEFGRLAGRPLGAERLAEIEQQVRAAAYEVRALKGRRHMRSDSRLQS